MEEKRGEHEPAGANGSTGAAARRELVKHAWTPRRPGARPFAQDEETERGACRAPPVASGTASTKRLQPRTIQTGARCTPQMSSTILRNVLRVRAHEHRRPEAPSSPPGVRPAAGPGAGRRLGSSLRRPRGRRPDLAAGRGHRRGRQSGRHRRLVHRGHHHRRAARGPAHPPHRRAPRGRPRPASSASTAARARRTSITCAGSTSTTAPTSPRPSTTCRSTFQPTPTARVTRISTSSSPNCSAESNTARVLTMRTRATSPPSAPPISTTPRAQAGIVLVDVGNDSYQRAFAGATFDLLKGKILSVGGACTTTARGSTPTTSTRLNGMVRYYEHVRDEHDDRRRHGVQRGTGTPPIRPPTAPSTKG